MRPHVRASLTTGVMKSVVRTRARSGESRHTAASSPVSEPNQQVAELGYRRGCARRTRTPLRWPDPSAVQEDDVRALLEAGLSERDVIDANQVVAYFNYVNRVAEGHGVQLEAHWYES